MTRPGGMRATRSSTETAYGVGPVSPPGRTDRPAEDDADRTTPVRLEQRAGVEGLRAVDHGEVAEAVRLGVRDLLGQAADAVAGRQRRDRDGGQHAARLAARGEEAGAAVTGDAGGERVHVARPATGGGAQGDAALRAGRR